MSGSLVSVLTAVADGARSEREVARRTGLDLGLVELAVLELVRLGRLERRPLSSGCPATRCGSCAFGGGAVARCALPGAALRQITLAHPDTSATSPTGTFQW